MNIGEELCSQLLQINAIKLSPQNPFTWASGIQSPIYCDNRIALSYPHVRELIIKGLDQISKSFSSYQSIAGVATAGIAHGALLANYQQLPFLYVRSKPKGHGRQNQIEGHLEKGSQVLVVEDLISTGGSCIKAVEAIKDDADVVGVAAIFSYELDKATNNFFDAGIKYETITGYGELIEVAVRENYISETDIDYLKEWRMNPEGWNPLVS